MSLINDAEPQFQKALEHLGKELSTLRTGRATPALVENIEVEAYGNSQPVKALGSISTPDARTVRIEPWDASVVQAIEKAIQEANIGITPTVDGKIIRLNLPMMTDESRQKLVKTMREKLEDARISVRQTREDVKKKIEKQEGVGKDEIRNELEKLDEAVKKINGEIEEIGNKKEKEITEI